MTKFAEILLPLPLPKLFTYAIPSDFQNQCAIGIRVVVPFGAKKLYSGIVLFLHSDEPEAYTPKEIISVLDKTPVVNKKQLKLWNWISVYYMCTQGEVMKAALPAGLKLESETKVYYSAANIPDDGLELSEKDRLVLDVVFDKKNLTVKEIQESVGKKHILPSIKTLLDRDLISIEERFKNSYKPKVEKYVKLTTQYYEHKKMQELFLTMAKAPKQLHLLMTFVQMSDYFNENASVEISKKQLLEKANAKPAGFQALVEKKILEIYEKEVARIEKDNTEVNSAKELNSAQQLAYNQIVESFESHNVTLLHGVTSSGKTEVYIHLINSFLEKGKQILYLLPEIAITTQIINRLKAVFGDIVGVYHSKFNDAERVEIWRNIVGQSPNNVDYQIILGVRSSVFLPFDNLGLVIVDEEHESTYKQFDPAPRYNARDAAIVLAQIHDAKTLLGTATPAIETYHNTQTQKYGLVEITERFQNIQMPEIIVADMREARRKKQMKSLFTPALLDGIETALNADEQVILFQNRRGFSPFLECQTCGWVPRCRHCDVSLTYHKYTNSLTCHYCGFTLNNNGKCGACNDVAMKTMGFGTEKIEDEISTFFPDVGIARMDFDTTRSKKAYQRIITDFELHKTKILVGTQMISKGLDFGNVSIVGILNADNMLNFPSFRAFERSYQLMAQVSGRAGRKKKRGKVIVQTNTPNHRIIKQVIDNDYSGMFRDEVAERKQFRYPPFYRIINITVKHKKTELVDEAADLLASSLREIFGQRILGPEYPPVARIQNYYLKTILLKIEKERSINKATTLIRKAFDNVKTVRKFSQVQLIANVDPM